MVILTQTEWLTVAVTSVWTHSLLWEFANMEPVFRLFMTLQSFVFQTIKRNHQILRIRKVTDLI